MSIKLANEIINDIDNTIEKEETHKMAGSK
jgi:ribosomal protein S7